MKKCPNCNRATMRTLDWACQWCGYPLLSSSWKVLPKTYWMLKQEERHIYSKNYDPVPKVEPVQQVEEKPAETTAPPSYTPFPVVPEPQEPVLQTITHEPEPTPEAITEEQAAGTNDASPAEEAPEIPDTEEVKKEVAPAEKEIKTGAAANSHENVIPLPAAPIPKELAATSPAVQFKDTLTVDEIYTIFDADRANAMDAYKDKSIKLSGVYYRLISSEQLEITYAILTSRQHYGELQVSCTFDKKYENELQQLTVGSYVTIDGKFSGYGARILIRDCILVS